MIPLCTVDRYKVRDKHVMTIISNSSDRCFIYKLPIEKGRTTGIPRDERICTKCGYNVIGDEYHYILIRPCMLQRNTQENTSSLLYDRPCMFKLGQLFNAKGKNYAELQNCVKP